jgi:O-antigen ligase
MTLAWWQRLLLLIALLSAGVTMVELLLLEHVEEWQQLIPVVLLAAAAVAILLLLVTSARWAVQLLRLVLIVCFVSALLGIYFHYQANVEFVLERHPRMTGTELFKNAIMGGMPALAPGAMAQLALIGGLATFERRSA